jgi:hypothetical protein
MPNPIPLVEPLTTAVLPFNIDGRPLKQFIYGVHQAFETDVGVDADPAACS